MCEPTFSPWGEVQDCDELYQGVFLVTTPGHGGIMVAPESVALLSPAAQRCGFREGGYLCFEEDSQEQVVLRELLDRKLWTIPACVSNAAAFIKGINENIQEYNPNYWAARERASARSQKPRKEKTHYSPER